MIFIFRKTCRKATENSEQKLPPCLPLHHQIFKQISPERFINQIFPLTHTLSIMEMRWEICTTNRICEPRVHTSTRTSERKSDVCNASLSLFSSEFAEILCSSLSRTFFSYHVNVLQEVKFSCAFFEVWTLAHHHIFQDKFNLQIRMIFHITPQSTHTMYEWKILKEK